MTARYEEGFLLFNERRFWHAHEAWEEVWQPLEHEPEGDFYKGLIQLAAALLHATRGNLRGAFRLLARSRSYLERYPRAAEALRRLDEVEAGLRAGEAVESILARILPLDPM